MIYNTVRNTSINTTMLKIRHVTKTFLLLSNFHKLMNFLLIKLSPQKEQTSKALSNE